MNGIGNTADNGVSELDEGQAAGLLAAVGGHGLSLVEPGPATDPAGSGLAYAIRRAYDSWRATQPQLFWTDENLWGGLDERDAGAVLLVEPSSGFAVGDGTPAAIPLAAAPSPLTNKGDAAHPSKVARRPQEVTVNVR